LSVFGRTSVRKPYFSWLKGGGYIILVWSTT
jgi:hypothetical protein